MYPGSGSAPCALCVLATRCSPHQGTGIFMVNVDHPVYLFLKADYAVEGGALSG